jgi:raffinose/stachyose/melibiose transport system permease protein
LPALIVYGAVMVIPTVYTLWISLNNWAGVGPMKWAGLENYRTMFVDPSFGSAFANTLWIVFGVGLGIFIIAFVLTMLMHDMWGRKYVRMIIFFPSLVPGIAVSILWGYVFGADGLINAMLRDVGVRSHPAWLDTDNLFRVIMLGMIWLGTGTYTVIFMAAVDRIPSELYDAAGLAGATPFQRFRYVTFPLMRDVIGVCSVLWCVSALKAFEFLLTFGSSQGSLPPRNVWNFALYSYAQSFGNEGVQSFGIAAASGVIVLLCTAMLMVLARRVLRGERVTY